MLLACSAEGIGRDGRDNARQGSLKPADTLNGQELLISEDSLNAIDSIGDDLDQFDYSAGNDSVSKASSPLRQAKALINAAYYDSAGHILNNYILHDSLNCEAWYLLGLMYDQRDNLPLAVRYYHKSIAVDSRCWEPYRDLAYMFDVFAQYDSMNVYLQKAVMLMPDPVALYYDFAYSFDMLNEKDSAITYYYQYLKAHPDDIDANLNVGAIWGANGNLDSAEIYTARALKIDPNYSKTCYNYAEILKSRGDIPKAIDYYQKALALEPKLVEAKLCLGEAYENLGDIAMARLYYKEFVDTAPIIYLDDINRIKAKLGGYKR